MSDHSAIEWTDATWSPIRARVKEKIGTKAKNAIGWYCEHVSDGCTHCYAERMNQRLGTGLPFKPGHRKDVDLFLDENMLTLPLRWKKPRMIFVCSMTDLFADFVPDEWIDKVFAVMALTPQHTYQVLTKRAARMRDYMASRSLPDEHFEQAEDIRVAMTTLAGTPSRREMAPALKAIPLGQYCKQIPWPLPNVWMGVSTERQQEADERIPLLLQTQAPVLFISAEPLLGPLDLTAPLYRGEAGLTMQGYLRDRAEADDFRYWARKLDWVIVGGESGPGARPMHPDWATSLRDQCAKASVPFFMKQMTKKTPIPDDLMIREFPHVHA